MAFAASLPSFTASTTVLPPFTISPAAKYFPFALLSDTFIKPLELVSNSAVISNFS